jgi:hypothetical protein
LRRIRGAFEEEDRAAADGIAWIPTGAHGDFGAPVAIEVASCDTDVVLGGEIAGDDRLLPIGTAVPGDFPSVGEEQVFAAIAVHISDGKPVADADRCVDHLASERQRRDPRCHRGRIDGGDAQDSEADRSEQRTRGAE